MIAINPNTPKPVSPIQWGHLPRWLRHAIHPLLKVARSRLGATQSIPGNCSLKRFDKLLEQITEDAGGESFLDDGRWGGGWHEGRPAFVADARLNRRKLKRAAAFASLLELEMAVDARPRPEGRQRLIFWRREADRNGSPQRGSEQDVGETWARTSDQGDSQRTTRWGSEKTQGSAASPRKPGSVFCEGSGEGGKPGPCTRGRAARG